MYRKFPINNASLSKETAGPLTAPNQLFLTVPNRQQNIRSDNSGRSYACFIIVKSKITSLLKSLLVQNDSTFLLLCRTFIENYSLIYQKTSSYLLSSTKNAFESFLII